MAYPSAKKFCLNTGRNCLLLTLLSSAPCASNALIVHRCGLPQNHSLWTLTMMSRTETTAPPNPGHDDEGDEGDGSPSELSDDDIEIIALSQPTAAPQGLPATVAASRVAAAIDSRSFLDTSYRNRKPPRKRKDPQVYRHFIITELTGGGGVCILCQLQRVQQTLPTAVQRCQGTCTSLQSMPGD